MIKQLTSENFLDYFAIEAGLIVLLLILFSGLGLCLGWLTTYRSRKRLKQLQQDRDQLLGVK